MRLTASVVTLLLLTSACFSTTRYRIPGDGKLNREYAKACHMECSSRLGGGEEYYQCLATCPGVETDAGASCTRSVRSTSIMCEEERKVRKGGVAGVVTGTLLVGVLTAAVLIGLSNSGPMYDYSGDDH